MRLARSILLFNSGAPRLGKKACALLLLVVATNALSGERRIWALWQYQIQNPEDHEAVLAHCEKFVQADPDSPFTPMAQTLASWHLLKTGRLQEAKAMLNPLLQPSRDPIRMGARELARAWLTRMDLENVRASLQRYYSLEVRYPRAISEIIEHPRIPSESHPPLTDRWGRGWTYVPEDFKIFQGLHGQRYRIESPILGVISSLDAALEIPFADLIRIEPARVLDTSGAVMVQFRKTEAPSDSDAVMVIQHGTMAEGFFLAHAGPRLIIVCDRLHWKVLTVPKQ